MKTHELRVITNALIRDGFNKQMSVMDGCEPAFALQSLLIGYFCM